MNFSGGSINVSGYTAVGHRDGSGTLNISGTAVLNTPDLKILMGKEGFSTVSGVLKISGDTAQINVANDFTMDESFLNNENKIIAELTTGGITTIDVGGTALIANGVLEVNSASGVYQPTAGDQYVLIDAAGGWDGAADFSSVSITVALASTDDILLHGAGFSGAGGSANKYELRVTSRGDFDGNFNVDGADLAVLKANYGSTSASYGMGDADEDGVVDGRDFVIWQQNFGAVALSSIATHAVPEPSTAILAFFALIGCVVRNKTSRCLG